MLTNGNLSIKTIIPHNFTKSHYFHFHEKLSTKGEY